MSRAGNQHTGIQWASLVPPSQHTSLASPHSWMLTLVKGQGQIRQCYKNICWKIHLRNNQCGITLILRHHMHIYSSNFHTYSWKRLSQELDLYPPLNWDALCAAKGFTKAENFNLANKGLCYTGKSQAKQTTQNKQTSTINNEISFSLTVEKIYVKYFASVKYWGLVKF